MRQVAADSMKEAMEEEAKATLEDMDKKYDEWEKTPIQTREKLPLIFSVDMGRQKGRPVRSMILSLAMLSWSEREQKNNLMCCEF